MGNCTVDSLAPYYSAGQGYMVVDGRLVDYFLLGRWGDIDANINDRATQHAALLADNPGHDYDFNAIPDDLSDTINYDTDPNDFDDIYMDPPYAEPYDGDMSDDHPMVVELRGGHDTPTIDQEVLDGWITPAPSTSGTSEDWEPITNTRGHDLENDAYNWDWIPDLGPDANTDSE